MTKVLTIPDPDVDLSASGICDKNWYRYFQNASLQLSDLNDSITSINASLTTINATLASLAVTAGATHGRVIYCDEHGMAGDFLTGSPTNNTPPWNALMSGAQDGDTFVLPVGYCGFNSQPSSIPDNRIKIIGSGGVSTLIKNYNSAGADFFIRMGMNDCHVANICLTQGVSKTGGVALGRVALPTEGIEGPYIINVQTSSLDGGGWHGGIWLDGAPGAPRFGGRRPFLTNLLLHSVGEPDGAAVGWGLRFGGMNASQITGIDIVPTVDIGATVFPGVWLTGDPDRPNYENILNITGCFNCDLTMQACNNVIVMAAQIPNLSIDSNCSSCLVISATNTTVSNSGTNCHTLLNGTLT